MKSTHNAFVGLQYVGAQRPGPCFYVAHSTVIQNWHRPSSLTEIQVKMKSLLVSKTGRVNRNVF